jgi:hypothetical protein
MESGLLSMEVAKKVYEKKQKNNKLTSPWKQLVSIRKFSLQLLQKRQHHLQYLQPKRRQQSPKYYLQLKRRQQTPKLHLDSLRNAKRKARDESSKDDFLITRKNTKKQKTS